MRKGFGRVLWGAAAGIVLLAGCAFAVEADSAVYATSDFTTGRLGVAAGDALTQVGTVAGDPGLLVFRKNGAEKVLYREPVNYGAGEDTVTVFDPANWSAPEANLRMGHNICGAVASGQHLFCANYYNDGTSSFLTKHDMNDQYKLVASLDLDDKNAANGSEYVKDVALVDGALFVLVERRDGAWPPAFFPSSLVKVDPSALTVQGSAELNPNPSTMAYSSITGKFYVACVGGTRNAATLPATSIQTVVPSTLAVGTFATAENLPASDRQYAFDQIGVAGGVLFVTGYFNGPVTWPAPNPCKVYSCTLLAPAMTERGSFTGWINDAATDPEQGRFWVSHRGTGQADGALVLYGLSGSEVRRFDEAKLGGVPYAVAPLTRTGGGSGGGSGGGCSAAAFSPFALFLLLPLLALRWRR